jgi:hypothetical protein
MTETEVEFKRRVYAHLPEWQRRQYLAVTPESAAKDVRREREAVAEAEKYEAMSTAERCVGLEPFLNDYD